MAKQEDKIFLVILVITLKLTNVEAASCETKKVNAPTIDFFVTPKHSLKGQPVQINVTCSGKSANEFRLFLTKMWITRNNTKISEEKKHFCSQDKVRTIFCNETLILTEDHFGNDSTIDVYCKSYSQQNSCPIVFRTIRLLDKMPTNKPPPTTAQAQVPIESSLVADPAELNTVQIISISIGSVALFICVTFVSVCIHRHIKQNRESDVIFDPICPEVPNANPNANTNEAVVNEFIVPVYPEDQDDGSSNQQDEIISVGPGLTLRIPKPPTVLGTGAFGFVVRGQIESYSDGREDTSPVAVKMLKDFDNQRHKKDFEKEVDSLKDLDHPNIVKLIATFSNSIRFYIIMEFLSKGNLLAMLHEEKHKRGNQQSNLGLQLLYKFSFDIACGMEYLAIKKKIHRDLAARNILVSEDYTAKISDFGLARSIEQSGYYIPTQGYVPLKWVALEALDTRSFCVETDIWSYGVVLWEIFTLGEEPYEFVNTEQPLSTLKDRLKQGYRLEKPELCSDETYDMMRRCWADDQKERPTFTELKSWAMPLAGLQ